MLMFMFSIEVHEKKSMDFHFMFADRNKMYIFMISTKFKPGVTTLKNCLSPTTFSMLKNVNSHFRQLLQILIMTETKNTKYACLGFHGGDNNFLP